MGIRLLYVIYGENVLDSGILHTHVRRMLELMSRRDDVAYIRLVSFISPRLWSRQRHRYHDLKRNLADNNVDLRLYPMVAAQKWNWLAVPIALFTSLPFLILNVLSGRFDIIHSRSYMAGLLGFLASKLSRAKIVFDTRGEYPEEMAINGRWSVRGLTYKLWKSIENCLIRNCDAVIGVTPAFRDRYRACGAKKALFVPNRTETDRFKPKTLTSEELDNPTLLFIGEMESVWYHPEKIASLFLKLQAYAPTLKLKIVTHSPLEYVKTELEAAGLEEADFTIRSATPAEIPAIISEGTIGLLPAHDNNDSWSPEVKSLIASGKLKLAIQYTGLWHVKFAEHLAAGVPMIVESGVGDHLTRPTLKHGLGIVVNENEPHSFSAVSDIIKNRNRYSTNCVHFARNKLDLASTVRQHIRLYLQLIGSRNVG